MVQNLQGSDQGGKFFVVHSNRRPEISPRLGKFSWPTLLPYSMTKSPRKKTTASANEQVSVKLCESQIRSYFKDYTKPQKIAALY